MEKYFNNPVIAPLLEQSKCRKYSKGQTILYPEDFSEYLFVIKEGAVIMHDIDDNGNQKILHIFGPYALFPMVSFSAEKAPVAWFYTALVDIEVYLLGYADLKQQFEQAGDVSAYTLLLKQLLEEVHEVLVRLNSVTKTNSLGRLVAALKFLVVRHSQPKAGGWAKINFPVSHQLLADITGLTRETVTLNMQQLQQSKCIRNPRVSILEVHIEKLAKIA